MCDGFCPFGNSELCPSRPKKNPSTRHAAAAEPTLAIRQGLNNAPPQGLNNAPPLLRATAAGTVEKFSFKPNPQFDPPDLETGVLTAMAGEIWIDPVEERVVRLAGSLQQDKEIGLGIVGELDKGGWIEIDQADVGEHQWRIVHLKLVMNGRVLFKAKNSNSVQEYSEFQSLPPGLSYKQAIEMLRRNSWAAGH